MEVTLTARITGSRLPQNKRRVKLARRTETMNQIWAPWRMDYILSPKDRACFLCSPSSRRALDRENHLLFRGPTCAVVLNRYPYIGGHLMVAPYRHVDGLDGWCNRRSGPR
jgi:hypothetical protein